MQQKGHFVQPDDPLRSVICQKLRWPSRFLLLLLHANREPPCHSSPSIGHTRKPKLALSQFWRKLFSIFHPHRRQNTKTNWKMYPSLSATIELENWSPIFSPPPSCLWRGPVNHVLYISGWGFTAWWEESMMGKTWWCLTIVGQRKSLRGKKKKMSPSWCEGCGWGMGGGTLEAGWNNVRKTVGDEILWSI